MSHGTCSWKFKPGKFRREPHRLPKRLPTLTLYLDGRRSPWRQQRSTWPARPATTRGHRERSQTWRASPTSPSDRATSWCCLGRRSSSLVTSDSLLPLRTCRKTEQLMPFMGSSVWNAVNPVGKSLWETPLLATLWWKLYLSLFPCHMQMAMFRCESSWSSKLKEINCADVFCGQIVV